MKETICLCTLTAIVAFCVGFLVCQNTTVKEKNNLIDAYDAYNKHTEEFLDTLEKYDNWVDRFDPQEYYEAREALDKVIWGL